MTQEEKAIAYDKALETARKINSGEGVAAPPDWTICEVIFPELKESGGEKVRKALINLFKTENFNGYTTLNGIDVDDVITWLEKQGEQRSKLVDFDYNAKDSDLQEVTYFIPNGFHAEMDGNKVVIKRGEKKTAVDFRAEDWCVSKVDGKIHNIYNSEVETKFHEGDWIVYKNDICQIVKREEGCNKLITTFGIEKELVNERNLSTAHLWTIQDAKDGDVLALNGEVFIYAHRKQMYSIAVAHCFVDSAGGFYLDGEFGYTERGNSIYPATKEQRDQLEKAMTDAGYTFDFEKKELRKIEQKPAWSEEDELLALSIEHVMNCASLLNIVPDKIDKIRAWLKSIKQRIEVEV